MSVASSSYYNTSLLNSLETRANTTAKYLNRYMAYSYEVFYNYASNMTTEFSEKDKLEMQIIDAYGRVMFFLHRLDHRLHTVHQRCGRLPEYPFDRHVIAVTIR